MSIGSRLYEIARTPFVFTAQATDFVIDAITHLPDSYEMQGGGTQGVIWGPFRSVFESFRDNVAGQASLTNDYKPGDSLVGMVLGPKGIIGATVEAIPEYVGPVPVRKAASEVLWTPFLESMQRSYKLFIDRPVGALATIGNIYGLEIIGNTDPNKAGWSSPLKSEFWDLETQGLAPEQIGQRLLNAVPGDLLQDDYDSVLFNIDTYKDVWNVTNSRSAGQAVALSLQNVDIFNPDAVQEFENTLYYQTVSGLTDLSLNIIGDPAYLVAKGIRANIGLRKAKETYMDTGKYILPPKTNLAPFDFPEPRPTRSGTARKRDPLLFDKFSYQPKWLKDSSVTPTVDELVTSQGFTNFRSVVRDIWYETLERTGVRAADLDVDYTTTGEKGTEIRDAALEDVIESRVESQVVQDLINEKQTLLDEQNTSQPDLVGVINDLAEDSQAPFFDQYQGANLYQLWSEDSPMFIPSTKTESFVNDVVYVAAGGKEFKGMPDPIFEVPVYHGARGQAADSLSSYIDDDGYLVLYASENFNGRVSSVSFTPFLDTAMDYGTRLPGSGGKRVDGVIFEIDANALGGRQRIESAEEVAITFDLPHNRQNNVRIPPNQFRVIDTRKGSYADELKSFSDEELAKRWIAKEIDGEITENLGVDVGFNADSAALTDEIGRRFAEFEQRQNNIPARLTEIENAQIWETGVPRVRRTNTEQFIDNVALNILRAGNEGRLGPGWKRMADDQAYMWAKMMAITANGAELTSSAWLPFDNLWRWNLGSDAARNALENQANFVVTLFKDANLSGFNNFVAEYRALTNQINHIEQTVRDGFPRGSKQQAEVQIQVLKERRNRVANLFDEQISLMLTKTDEFLAKNTDNVDDVVPAKGTPEFDEFVSQLDQLKQMPWNAILSTKEDLLKTLVKRVDPPNVGPDKAATTSRNIDGFNDSGSIIEAATYEILNTAHIPTAPTQMLPYLGASSRAGFSARTFLEKSDKYNELRAKRAVRVVVDKVAQSTINWNNLPHAYEQIERALRDYGRIEPRQIDPRRRKLIWQGIDAPRDANVTMFDIAGINPDKLITDILNAKNMNARRLLWDNAVETMNQALVNEFLNVADPANKGTVLIANEKVTQILRGQLTDVKDLILESGVKTDKAYTNADFTVVNFADDGAQFHLGLPISPSQLGDTSVVPRYDMYKQLTRIAEGDFREITNPATGIRDQVHIGAARAKVRAVRRGFSTVWKRSVLLTPRWQMVVNLDSLLRTVASVGAGATFARLGGRFDDLRARWLRRAGIDVTGIVARELDEWATEWRANNKEDLGIWVDDPVLMKDPIAQWARGENVTEPLMVERSPFVKNADLYNNVTDGGFEEFVTNIIDREYAASRRMRRTSLMTGAGLFFAGPVGAAVSAVTYNKYARTSLASAARRQVAETYGQAIMLEAADSLNRLETLETAIVKGYTPDQFDIRDFDSLTPDEIGLLEDGVPLEQVMAIAKTNRREAARLLSARAELVTEYQKVVVDQFRATQPELAGRFDQAAEILSDVGYDQSQLGNAVIQNAWGDTPQLQEVWKRVNSSNASARHLWNEENAVLRKSERYQGARQYDYTTPNEQSNFINAYDDYMNRHASSQGVPGVDAHRDFWRQFWLNKSDKEIYEWMQTEGRQVIDDMPEEFQTPEGMQNLIDNVRYEANSLVPNRPEFAGVRNQLAKGERITWLGDVQPVLDEIRKIQDEVLAEILTSGADMRVVDGYVAPFGSAGIWAAFDAVKQQNNITNSVKAAQYLETLSTVERIRLGSNVQPQTAAFADIRTWEGGIDFGKTVNSSEYADALQTRELRKRAVSLIDQFFTTRFENLSLVEDTISRGTMFEAVYERTMADNLQRYRMEDGTYKVTGEQINQMSQNARQQALFETKQVLYDLAERSRFEELMTELMPFLGAWTEVATRWMGLAGQNPVFVARALRPWHVITAKDENNQTRLLFKMPNVFDTDSPGALKSVPFMEKLFGPVSVLTNETVDLNLGSASMIGAMPGAGPIYQVLATEAVIALPELTEFLDWSLPYGYAEGDNAVTRFVNAHTNSWIKSVGQMAGLETNSRSATAVRVSQDYLAQMHEQGQQIPNTPAEIAEFEAEVERRVKMIYGMRMFRSIAVPVSFRQQSPYQAIIQNFYRIEDEHDAEVADYWLLENHPELWSFTGRKYATAGVIAGNLEGHINYERHKEIADEFPELGGFVTGSVGAIDVQFERNRAVRDAEIREGRREYLEPAGILTEAAEAIGWREYRVFRNSLDAQLRVRVNSGGSASLNAKSNQDLRRSKDEFVQQLGTTNPNWLAEFNTIGRADKQRRILDGFRQIVADPTFAYRPEIPEIEMFLALHDSIGYELQQRATATGNDQYLRLSYNKNEDLDQRWNVGLLQILQYPDFGPIYDRYFSKIDSVSTKNLPVRELIGAP